MSTLRDNGQAVTRDLIAKEIARLIEAYDADEDIGDPAFSGLVNVHELAGYIADAVIVINKRVAGDQKLECARHVAEPCAHIEKRIV